MPTSFPLSAYRLAFAVIANATLLLSALAKDCPLYPLGITGVTLHGKNVLVSVSAALPLSMQRESIDLALATAKLEAKHALAKAVSGDGKALSGVTELFSCGSRGKVYSGVVVQPPISPGSNGNNLLLPRDPKGTPISSGQGEASTAPGSSQSFQITRRAETEPTVEMKKQSAVNEITGSIDRSIRQNPSPTPDLSDYEMPFPDSDPK
jgi:hypothetical protein